MKKEKDKQIQKTKEILDKISTGIDILVPIAIVIAFVLTLLQNIF